LNASQKESEMVPTEKVEGAENASRNLNAKETEAKAYNREERMCNVKGTKILKEPKCNFVRK
jgi:hypothetical protein